MNKFKNKRIQVWIKTNTHQQLNEMLKDDANRIASAKASKGALVDLGLQLLFQARKNQTLEQIYLSVYGGGNYE